MNPVYISEPIFRQRPSHAAGSKSYCRMESSQEFDVTILRLGLKATLLHKGQTPSNFHPTLDACSSVVFFHYPLATYEPFGLNESLQIFFSCTRVSSKSTYFVIPSKTLNVPSSNPNALIRLPQQAETQITPMPWDSLSLSVPEAVSKIGSVPSPKQKNMRRPPIFAAMPVAHPECPLSTCAAASDVSNSACITFLFNDPLLFSSPHNKRYTRGSTSVTPRALKYFTAAGFRRPNIRFTPNCPAHSHRINKNIATNYELSYGTARGTSPPIQEL